MLSVPPVYLKLSNVSRPMIMELVTICWNVGITHVVLYMVIPYYNKFGEIVPSYQYYHETHK